MSPRKGHKAVCHWNSGHPAGQLIAVGIANCPIRHIAGFNDVTRATALVSRASCGRAPFRSDFV